VRYRAVLVAVRKFFGGRACRAEGVAANDWPTFMLRIGLPDEPVPGLDSSGNRGNQDLTEPGLVAIGWVTVA
jgi:hypothetical protein